MVVGGLVLVFGIIFITLRWRFVLANKPRFFETFHADGIGYMVTVLSPIPGPAMRVVALTQSSEVSISRATPAMIVDTLLGTVMRLVALILAIILYSPLEIVTYSILIGSLLIVAILGFLTWFVRHPERIITWLSGLITRLPDMRGERLQRAMTDLQEGMTAINSLKGTLIALLLSLVMWSFFLIFQYLVFKALPVDLTDREMLTLAAGALVVLPPSAPAMIGVYQGILVAFLLLFRITGATTLTAYALLVFAVQLVIWLVLGSWGLIRTHMKIGDLLTLTRDVVRGDVPESGQENNLQE